MEDLKATAQWNVTETVNANRILTPYWCALQISVFAITLSTSSAGTPPAADPKFAQVHANGAGPERGPAIQLFDICPHRIKNIQFSAEFEWSNEGSPRRMVVQVGPEARAPELRKSPGFAPPPVESSALTAHLSSGAGAANRCEAVCQVKSFYREKDKMPVSMELACQSPGLNMLVSPAAILWFGGTLKIRLGSWTQGFQEKSLAVRVDLYSAFQIRKSRFASIH